MSIQSDRLRLGDVTIYRIADIGRIAWPAKALFDDLAALELLKEAVHFPHAVNAQSSELILSFNSYIVQSPDYLCLIDSGIGNDKDRLDRPAWHLRSGDFMDRLHNLGFRPEQFDFVINTHLHADHVGWNTVKAAARWIPTFPNARYVVPALELEHCRQKLVETPSAKVLHGAYEDSIAPILAAKKYEAVQLPFQLAPNLWLESAPGHTLGMAVVRLKTDADELLFLADVMHSPLQLRVPNLTSRFCADGALACETRARILEQCAKAGTLIATYHFPSPVFGKVIGTGGAYDFHPLAQERFQ